MVPAFMKQHEFEHNGGRYRISAALVADHPAVYSIEVTRNPGEGSHGQSLVTLTIRADYDHSFVADAMPIESAFRQGEQLVKAMYL